MMRGSGYVFRWMLLAGTLAYGAGAQTADSAAQTDTAMQPAPEKTAHTFADKRKPAPVVRQAPRPLTQRERVVQLLDRFTYGPRPGEVDRVLATGADNWLTQQLNPQSVKDAALERRLNDYPTIAMQPLPAVMVFPDRAQIDMVADGRLPMPTDAMEKAEFEVGMRKREIERDQKTNTAPPPSDEEKAAKKKADQQHAAQLFAQLIVLPKQQRMAAIEAMPVEDRIVLTANGNLTGDQRNALMNDFNPREKETFLAMSGGVGVVGNLDNELAQARVLRDILSERQLEQVMTNFWFNHFNVFQPKDSDHIYTASYERDVIRKNALTTFPQLLLATAQSPAMMIYLDNWLSIGPDSLANGVDPAKPNSKKGNKGLNENYGREVMELHTVGVNGGYSQADVTALSAILTGWGVDTPNKGGGFLFDYKRHEPGPKVWFGYVIQEDGTYRKLAQGERVEQTFGPAAVAATPDSVKQGVTALRILAESPQTAHFISWKLAQYFVADAPPPSLVSRLQAVYLETHGDIKALLRAMIASPEFNARQYFHTKVKTPEEFIASAFRATGTEPVNPGALVGTIRQMGMPLYDALPPTGYYITADKWMNSDALVDRLNFTYQLTRNGYANQKFDAPKLLATGVMLSPVALEGTGQQVALNTLEATVIPVPVSARTNQLIMQQMKEQTPAAGAAVNVNDTLTLLSALVLGSPEFQQR